MKKTFTIGLGAVALVALTVLVTTSITSTVDRRKSDERIVMPVPFLSNDTSNAGSGTGSIPRAFIINPADLPAGSIFVVECANKDCAGIGGAAGSGAAPGSPKILFELSIPSDLPANTEMSLSFRPALGSKSQTSR